MELELEILFGEVREVYRVAREVARYLVSEPEYGDPQSFDIELEGVYEAAGGWEERLLGAAICAEGVSLWQLNAGSAKGRWKENGGEVAVSYQVTLHDAGKGNVVRYSCEGSASVEMDPKTLRGASLVAYGISKIIQGRGDNSEGMFDAGLEAEPRLMMRPSDPSCEF